MLALSLTAAARPAPAREAPAADRRAVHGARGRPDGDRGRGLGRGRARAGTGGRRARGVDGGARAAAAVRPPRAAREKTREFGSPDPSPEASLSTSVQRGAGMVAEGLSFHERRRKHPLRPASVERLVEARSAHGDSPHTLRALRGDLGDLCEFLAQQGLTPETCGSEPLRRWQAQLASRRLAPATIARRLSSVRALFGDLVRRGERPGRSVARARRPAPGPPPARPGHRRRLRDAARRRLERGPAQSARPRHPGAALRLRPARERGLRSRARRPTTPPPATCA